MDIRDSVVGILNTKGNIVGTGFLASSNLILTCAHVIDSAGSGPGREVGVRFIVDGSQQTAYVSDKWWASANNGDVAVLQITTAPAGVEPVTLGNSSGSAGHSIRTFGFPEINTEGGLRADGRVIGSIRMGDHSFLQLGSTQITPGFSGAPVLDTQAKRVLGMVTQIAMPDIFGKQGETAFATPSEVLRIFCPEIPISDPFLSRILKIIAKKKATFITEFKSIIQKFIFSLKREPHFMFVALLVIITLTIIWIRQPRCPYNGATDDETIRNIIQAEARAVNKKDLEIIKRIFSPTAFITKWNGNNKEQSDNPVSYYLLLFQQNEYKDAEHFGILPVGVGTARDRLWYVSGSKGSYRIKPSTLWNEYNNWSIPGTQYGSDHWEFRKDNKGCWVITSFAINAGHVQFPP